VTNAIASASAIHPVREDVPLVEQPPEDVGGALASGAASAPASGARSEVASACATRSECAESAVKTSGPVVQLLVRETSATIRFCASSAGPPLSP